MSMASQTLCKKSGKFHCQKRAILNLRDVRTFQWTYEKKIVLYDNPNCFYLLIW